MELKGNLDSSSLQEILTTLAQNKQIGTLIVSDGESTKYIYFARAGVRLLSSGSRKNPKLGDLLVKRGKITPDQLQAVLARQEETGEMIGKILTDWGLVTEEEIDDTVAGQIEEEIFDLFTWENATFKFTEGPPPRELFDPNQRATRLTFDVHQLVEKASKHVATMSRAASALPGSGTVYALGEFTELEFYEREDSDPVKRIVKAIDGARSVEDVVAAAGLSEAEASDILAQLLRDKKIEKVERAAGPAVPGKELTAFVAQCEKELAANPDNAALRERLAQAYSDLGSVPKAAAHLLRVVDIHRGAGRLEEALAVSRRIVEIDPNNLENRERSLKIHFDLRDTEGVLADAGVLAELYRGHGDSERVKNMYKLVLEIVPDDIEIRRKVINICLDAGDKEAAAEEYDAIGKLLEAKGDTAGLQEVYQKILRLAPHRRDLLKKIQKTTDKPRVRIPRGRFHFFGRVVRILLILAVLAGLGYAGWWEYNERLAAAPILDAADAALLQGNFDDAVKALEKWKVEHPYSTVAYLEVPKRLEQVATARREREERKREEARQVVLRDGLQLEDLLGRDRGIAALPTAERMQKKEEIQKEFEGFAACGRENEHVKKAKEWVEKRKTERRVSQELLAEAERQEANGSLKQGRELRKRLLNEFGDTPAAANLKMPFLVDSVPTGAEVTLDGTPVGRTPYRHYHDPLEFGRILTFLLRLDGYLEGKLEVDIDRIETEEVFSTPLRKKPLWSVKTGDVIEGPPVVGKHMVYAGSRDGFLYAVDTRAVDIRRDTPCAPAWRFKNPARQGLGGIVHAPVLAGDLIVFPHTDAYLYAVRNGVEVWSFGLGQGNAFVGTPLIAQKRVVVGAGVGRTGFVLCLPLETGERPYWKYPAREEMPRIASPPLLGQEGQTVFLATVERQVLALDLLNGRSIGSLLLDSPVASPLGLQDEGLLFVVTRDLQLLAMDFTGIRKGIAPSLRWRISLKSFAPDDTVNVEPLAFSGQVVLCTEGGRVLAFDTRGQQVEKKWEFKTQGPIRGKPVVSLGTLYVGSHDRNLYALTFWEGNESSKFQTPWRINGLAVQEGVIYGTTEEGDLFAVRAG
jgi:outer membrane protein assembly factor BamB/tetratricopeptide (TPR) repeat protein